MKRVLFGFVVVVLLAGAGYGGFRYGYQVGYTQAEADQGIAMTKIRCQDALASRREAENRLSDARIALAGIALAAPPGLPSLQGQSPGGTTADRSMLQAIVQGAYKDISSAKAEVEQYCK